MVGEGQTVTGRYLQADPLGLVDGASVYGYALQNPGRYVDPTGQFIQLLPGILAGCLIGGTGAVFASITDKLYNDKMTFEELRCEDPGPAFIGGCIGGALGAAFGPLGATVMGPIGGVIGESAIADMMD